MIQFHNIEHLLTASQKENEVFNKSLINKPLLLLNLFNFTSELLIWVL